MYIELHWRFIILHRRASPYYYIRTMNGHCIDVRIIRFLFCALTSHAILISIFLSARPRVFSSWYRSCTVSNCQTSHHRRGFCVLQKRGSGLSIYAGRTVRGNGQVDAPTGLHSSRRYASFSALCIDFEFVFDTSVYSDVFNFPVGMGSNRNTPGRASSHSIYARRVLQICYVSQRVSAAYPYKTCINNL